MSQHLPYNKVFTPHSPVNLSELFVGRSNQLERLTRAIYRHGTAPFVVGARGVGKTSLLIQAIKNISAIHKEYVPIHITCDKSFTFDKMSKIALSHLDFDINVKQINNETSDSNEVLGEINLLNTLKLSRKTQNPTKTNIIHDGIGNLNITPYNLLEILKKLNEPIIIIIDEFDIMKNNKDFVNDIAIFIKILSDHSHSHECTIVLSGVGSSMQNLFSAHESCHRQIVEIFVPMLKQEDIRSFLKKTEELLDFQFADRVRDILSTEATGFPYFAHLLGECSYLTAKERNPQFIFVTEDDYEYSKEQAAEEAFREQLSQFKNTIRKLQPEEIEIIKCLNLTNSSLEIKEIKHLAISLNENIEQNFDNILESIIEKYNIIKYHPSDHRKITFINPLLRPALKLRIGYPDGKLAILPKKNKNQIEMIFDENDSK
ncbi:MAG: ATP-binding protein [Armatimonas sp.]